MRPRSGKWQVIATISCCAVALLMLCLSGCSSANAAAAAESAASATAANVVAAATQPSTVTTVTSAAVSTAQGASSPQAICGRWVRNGQVINIDGTLGTGVLTELVFNKNGRFVNTSRAGVTAFTCTGGTFQVLGNVLTTHVGVVQQSYTFKIKGTALFVTNSKTRQTIVFQRG